MGEKVNDAKERKAGNAPTIIPGDRGFTVRAASLTNYTCVASFTGYVSPQLTEARPHSLISVTLVIESVLGSQLNGGDIS